MKSLSKADDIFFRNISDILKDGVISENARPTYKDGTQANSKYITSVFDKYNLSKGEFPITSLRRIAIKSAIKELCWIYQDQTSDLSVLKDKYDVHYWDAWNVGDGTIGKRYGAVVKEHNIIDKLLRQLEDNPWNRRNIISLWDYDSFEESPGLQPCAFLFMVDVRKVNDEMYLDATLTQRSNDMLVAHHINAMQYVALQMMIACHFGWKVGTFSYFVQNLHIYDNQLSQAEELLKRYKANSQIMTSCFGLQNDLENFSSPSLVLHAKAGTNFYDIKHDDFEIVNYEPLTPQLKFDLAI